MSVLSKGQNVTLEQRQVMVRCSWGSRPGLDADLSALLLTDGRVSSDDAFIFYNQPSDPTGSVRHDGKTVGTVVHDTLSLDLSLVPASVDTIAVAVSLDATPPATLANLSPVQVDVLDVAGAGLVTYTISDFTSETAAVTLEVYRRNSDWKVRAVGQGYSDGLAGLARDFGVQVEDPPTAAPVPVSGGIDWFHPPVPAGYS